MSCPAGRRARSSARHRRTGSVDPRVEQGLDGCRVAGGHRSQAAVHQIFERQHRRRHAPPHVAARPPASRQRGPKSAPKVCASVPMSSFSRSASERRSTATGTSCSPTTTIRPPGRTRSTAWRTMSGTPVHSKTTVGEAPASRSANALSGCAATAALGAQGLRNRQAVGVQVDAGHGGAAPRRGVHHEGADAAGAHHDGVLAGTEPTPAHGVHGDRHRLSHRRHVRSERPLRQVDAGRGGHGGELRQGAVALQAHGPVMLAEVGAPPRRTPRRSPQETPAPQATGSPSANPSTPRPVPATTPGELVARHHRSAVARHRIGAMDREHLRPGGVLGGVGPADPHARHPNQEFTVTRLGPGEVLEADVPPGRGRRLPSRATPV